MVTKAEKQIVILNKRDILFCAERKSNKYYVQSWLIKLNEGAYLLIIDGDTITINDSITYSGSLIYFNEPKTATRIFKERNAEIRQITPAGNHTYIIKDEKGKLLNNYFYENGILQQATMRHALGNVKLKRVIEE